MLILVMFRNSKEIEDILIEHSPSYTYLIPCGYGDAAKCHKMNKMNIFLVYNFDLDNIIQVVGFMLESRKDYYVTIRDLLRSRGFDPNCFVIKINDE